MVVVGCLSAARAKAYALETSIGRYVGSYDLVLYGLIGPVLLAPQPPHNRVHGDICSRTQTT